MMGARLDVADLGSHNGTFVDGERIEKASFTGIPHTLRVGDTLFIFVPRVESFLSRGLEVRNGFVVGPCLHVVRERLAQIAQSSSSALITGPTGVGKELAASYFHAAGPRADGPFVAVNAATIPFPLAERLLFGAQRGAYSGADVHSEGYVQAADGGTLFLDEIAELDLSVQAKLLRVLETREVLPLGATKSRKVQLGFCGATLKDLRAEVAAGRFRNDLYQRIGRPEVRIPTLNERAEEIPWIAALEAQRSGEQVLPTAGFIEACLLREWPGNVRELIQTIREAVNCATVDGRTLLQAADILAYDGQSHSGVHGFPPASGAPPASNRAPLGALRHDIEVVERRRISAALAQCDGNRKKAAKVLGIARNTLASRMERLGIDVASAKAIPREREG
jgi:DNA-binding NtrC family response regulator